MYCCIFSSYILKWMFFWGIYSTYYYVNLGFLNVYKKFSLVKENILPDGYEAPEWLHWSQDQRSMCILQWHREKSQYCSRVVWHLLSEEVSRFLKIDIKWIIIFKSSIFLEIINENHSIRTTIRTFYVALTSVLAWNTYSVDNSCA